MPALVIGTPGTTSGLNWFITVGGVKNDAYEVGWRILDISSGLPGSQVYPTSGFQDATSAPAKFDTGSYYAYDPDTGLGWTPTVAYNVGTHRIEWRWKITSSSPYKIGYEDFEILSEAGAPAAGPYYIDVQAIRDEGFTVAMASDAKVLTYIGICQQLIERACRQWFESRSITLKLDGTDSDTLHLPVPIISCTSLKINDSQDALDSSYYRVYNGRDLPDDRKNPRIKLINSSNLDIYTAPIWSRDIRFRKGRQNQEIVGTFGYTEPDGSTPLPIIRALTKLTIEKLGKPLFYDPSTTVPPPAPPAILGNILEEWVDGRKVKYAQTGGELEKRRVGLTGITSDPEILDIIILYKAPIGMATLPGPSYNP